MNKREEQLSSIIQQEVARLLFDIASDKGVLPPSITRVNVSADLSWADVYLSFMGDVEPEAELKRYRNELSHVRNALRKRVTLKKVPMLRLWPDSAVEGYSRIEQLLDDISESHD